MVMTTLTSEAARIRGEEGRRMSDNTQIVGDDGQSTDSNPNAELRAYADRLKDENTALRAEMLGFRLDAIGLNVNEGLGKAVAKEYKGDLTVEAVTAFVKDEYSYTPPAAPPDPTVEPTLVEDAGQRVEGVLEQTEAVPPPIEPDEIAEGDKRLAEEDATVKDAERSMEAKLRAFQQLR